MKFSKRLIAVSATFAVLAAPAALALSLTTFQKNFVAKMVKNDVLANLLTGIWNRDLNQPGAETFSLATCSANSQAVTIQVNDSSALLPLGGNSASALSAPATQLCYLSSASTGLGFATAATSLSIGASGSLAQLITGQVALVTFSASGAAVVNVNGANCTTTNVFLACVGPDNKMFVSTVLTY